jgi:hypothetical protein
MESIGSAVASARSALLEMVIVFLPKLWRGRLLRTFAMMLFASGGYIRQIMLQDKQIPELI